MIKQVDFEFTAINLDNIPYDIVLGVVPYYQAASVTLDQLKELNGSVVKTLGVSTGQGRSVIKKSFNVEHHLGINSTTRQLWLNIADARSLTPMDTGHPAVVFKAGPITTGAVNGISVTTKITFHIEFFELEMPAISTVKAHRQFIDAEKEDNQSMSDEDMYETPSSVRPPVKSKLPAHVSDDDIYEIRSSAKSSVKHKSPVLTRDENTQNQSSAKPPVKQSLPVLDKPKLLRK
jgi:hypothetical protein